MFIPGASGSKDILKEDSQEAGLYKRDVVEKGAHASESCNGGFSAVYFYVLGGSEKWEGEPIY